jgi:hypothetical protein
MPDFSVTIGNKIFTERAEGGQYLIDMANNAKIGETTEVGSFKSFSLSVEKTYLGMTNLVLQGKTEYRAEMSASSVGNMVKLENLFDSIPEKAAYLADKISNYNRDLANAKDEYGKPFPYADEFKEKLARQEELDNILLLENPQADISDLLNGEDRDDDGDDEFDDEWDDEWEEELEEERQEPKVAEDTQQFREQPPKR